VTAPWKVIVYFGSDGAMYANTITPDGIKVDSNGKKVNENVINAKSYIGTYRTESGHAIGGSQGFTITIQKIENNKIWGAFSWGGDLSGRGYGEWNGAPIINTLMRDIEIKNLETGLWRGIVNS